MAELREQQSDLFAGEEGRYLENIHIEPDILGYNDPASVLRGDYKQLEAAVA